MSRLKRYAINSFDLAMLLKELVRSKHMKITGLPERAMLTRTHYDADKDVIWLVYQDDSFDPVPEGCLIPEGVLTIEPISDLNQTGVVKFREWL